MLRLMLLACLISGTVYKASCAAPTIITYSESASSGDIIYLQGDFGAKPSLQYSFLDDHWLDLPVLSTGKGIITAKLPSGENRSPDVLAVRVTDDQGWSSPVFINKPIPLSFDTDTISAGGSFRIFGRNLFIGIKAPAVYFIDAAGNRYTASVNLAISTHYALQVQAPPDIKAGTAYKVLVSNGYQGSSATPFLATAPTTLKGRTTGTDFWNLGLPWATDLNFYSNVYNVKTDQRLQGILAVGDGKADDTWALMHAIRTAAGAGGGVVFLPEGTYGIHFANGCGIPLMNRVVLVGAGQGKTFVNYGYPAGTQGGFGVCFASSSGMVDLTISNVDTQQLWTWSGLSQTNDEVFLKRVTWNIGTSQWVSFVDDTHVTIQDSTLKQLNDSAAGSLGPLNMQNCHQCSVARSTIAFVVCGILFDGAQDMVFEDNRVSRDISLPQRQGITHSVAANFTKNFMVLNNTFESIGNAPMTSNDGEVLATEGGGDARFDEFRGSISVSTPTSLTDTSQDFSRSANYFPNLRPGKTTVAIVSGNGLGQTRSVIGVSADHQTLQVDRPWDVVPEAGSHYATFDWSAENWTVVGNRLISNYKAFEVFNASAINLLFERNQLIDSDGIMISPCEHEVPGAGSLFNVILGLSIIGNSIIDNSGLRPAFIAVYPREDVEPQPFGTQVIGATVKGNSITGHVPSPIGQVPPAFDDYKLRTEGINVAYFWQTASSYSSTYLSPIIGTILQMNTVAKSASGYYLNSGAYGTVIDYSLLYDVKTAIQDEAIMGSSEASQATSTQHTLNLFSALPAPENNVVRGTATTFGRPALSLKKEASNTTAVANSVGDGANIIGVQLTQNEVVSVHVTLPASSAQTGWLTLRALPNPNSPFASIGLASGSLSIVTRASNAGTVQTHSVPVTGDSIWLRLSKAGSIISASYSPDGKAWNSSQISAAFPSRSYIAGMMATSPDTSGGPPVFDSFDYGPSPSVLTGANQPKRTDLQYVGRFVAWLWHGIRKVVHHLA